MSTSTPGVRRAQANYRIPPIATDTAYPPAHRGIILREVAIRGDATDLSRLDQVLSPFAVGQGHLHPTAFSFPVGLDLAEPDIVSKIQALPL